jgi:hypothetical protein
MLELIKFILEKIDVLSISEAIREEKNRKASSRLFLILVTSYEIIEEYERIISYLMEFLKGLENTENEFYFNSAYMINLLNKQAFNLEKMDVLLYDLVRELRVVDNKFYVQYKELIPGKFGLLDDARSLLMSGRLSLVESGPSQFPADRNGSYRTLWFTETLPDEDREETEKYLYGWDGTEKNIVDVNIHDGPRFIEELKLYFERVRPFETLALLEGLTESYKNTLINNFTLEEVISEVGRVKTF